MGKPWRFAASALAGFLAACAPSAAAPIISEVLLRPGTGWPEDPGLEFIELFNPDSAPADLSGWRFTDGIAWTFPNGTILPAGGRLVVAARPDRLNAPGALGPWSPETALANDGERLTLTDAAGSVVCTLRCAVEGDWAQRAFDATTGWHWRSAAPTAGHSLELRDPTLPIDAGANWGASLHPGGTPGAANSIAAPGPPLITAARHVPAVPRPGEPVRIACRISGRGPDTPEVTLHWRDTTAAVPGPWRRLTMLPGPGGEHFTWLDPLPAGTVAEYFVRTVDARGTRQWPPVPDGAAANGALFQVDAATDAGPHAVHRFIMSGAELTAYEATAATNPLSDRRFTTTFIAGTGPRAVVRHRTDIRLRGQSSRIYSTKSWRVMLPGDQPWDGVDTWALNSKFPWLQLMGLRCFGAAGLVAHDTEAVAVRRNGTLVESVSGFGLMLRLEEFGGDFADRHWPAAAAPQLYRKPVVSHWQSGAPAPADPDLLWSGWSKQNRSAANDWSDVMQHHAVWQQVCASLFPGGSPGNLQTGTWNGSVLTDPDLATLSEHNDLPQLARWFAVATLLQNGEPSIGNGHDNDYAAAWVRGTDGRRRMQLVPHDLDTILGLGDTPAAFNATGLYDMTENGSVMKPLLPLFGNAATPGHPGFRSDYLRAIRELCGGPFSTAPDGPDNVSPCRRLVDDALGSWVPADRRDAIVAFLTNRRAYLLGLAGGDALTPTAPQAAATLTSPAGQVRIAEVLAVNGGSFNHAGTTPGAIELHNAGLVAASLAGWQLALSGESSPTFTLPGGTQLPAGARVVIIADALATPGMHTGFTLPAAGGTLVLRDASGGVRDSLTFGLQAPDLGLARTGPVGDTWAPAVPSLGAPNPGPTPVAGPAGLHLGEWAAHPWRVLAAPFLELHNPGSLPAACGGTRLGDEPSGFPDRLVLPPLSFIGPGSRAVLTDPPLRLAAGGQLAWIDAAGSVIDRVLLPGHGPDQSVSRSAGITAMPTPGEPDAPWSAARSALVAHLRIAEIHFRPAASAAEEFVEVHNTGAAPLDLSGVAFSSGIGYAFPDGTVLAAGARLVVCRDRTRFAARFPDAVGFLAPEAFSGALDNAGERLAIALPGDGTLVAHTLRYQSGWQTAADASLQAAASEAADWSDAFAWTAAPPTPGTAGPPAIIGAAAADGIAGDPLTFQLRASRAIDEWRIAGLPQGLTLDAATGRITGTPTAFGVTDTVVTAREGAVSATGPLRFVIASAGAPQRLSWDHVPATAVAGKGMAVLLTVRDAVGRRVREFNGQAAITAVAAASTTDSPLVFTEVTDEGEDQFELQNVGSAPLDTRGWTVRVGDSTTSVQAVNAITWPLPDAVAPGECLRVSETSGAGRRFFGGPINWATTISRGWLLLTDASGTVRDFFAFGWPAADLASLEVSGIRPVTLGHWSGPGALPGTRGNVSASTDSWQRVGSGEANTAADWTWSRNAVSWGTTNAGLAQPWVAGGTALTLTPAVLDIVAGAAAAPVVITETGRARLNAAADDGLTGVSEVINLTLPPPDTDADGMPDAWETANGLNPALPDAAADADGDGLTNRAEFLAGTAPRDAASVLRVTGVAPRPSGATLTWQAQPGVLYRVTGSHDLTSWTPHGPSMLVPASGPLVADVPASPRFWRVETVPLP